MNGEKRLFERAVVKIIANCSKNQSEVPSKEDFISFTRDISLQGACLITSKRIKAGERFTVRLEVPTYFIPLLAYSEVMWTKDINRVRGSTETGIKFLRMDRFDANKLENFLRCRWDSA